MSIILPIFELLAGLPDKIKVEKYFYIPYRNSFSDIIV